MKRSRKWFGIFAVALMVMGLTGCSDGVRQTVVPYLISGMQTVADGVFTGDNMTASLSSGGQQITDGLLAGLAHALYPKG